MKKRQLEEADKSLEKANKLLNDDKSSLTRFLQMLDSTGEKFPKGSTFSFKFEEDNVEANSIESILNEFYGLDLSSPFYFEFNGDI